MRRSIVIARSTFSVAVVSLLLALPACGGSRSSIPSGISPPGNAAGKRSAVIVKLSVPSAAKSAQSHRRTPRYVSRATRGIGISYHVSANGGPAVAFPIAATPDSAFDVSAGSASCIAASDGSRTCSLGLNVPAGTDDFEVTAWDAVASGGSFATVNRLSAATVLNVHIAAATQNALSFVLNGVVDSIALAISPERLAASDAGSLQTATLAVNAKDVDGNVILGDGDFVDAAGDSVAITLAQQAVGPGSAIRTSIAATPIAPSASSVTVQYSGGVSSGTRFVATTDHTIPGSNFPATLTIAPRGAVTEFALATGSQPAGIISAADGTLWFVDYGDSVSAAVGQFSTAGTLLQRFAIGGSYPELLYVAQGADSAIWYTGRNAIGRATTGGVQGSYTTGNSRPWGIARLGGDLWFTENTTNTISRITASGVITRFSAGISANANLGEVTAGADGNLWFTEADAGQIGRITPAGVVTEFGNGITAGATPLGIASGPDGDIWFCEATAAKIGRIDPNNGTVNEYPIGSGNAPADITAGADGTMWFTERNSDTIGRVDMTGAVNEYSTGITVGSGPLGITTSADGTVWFTEFDGGRIAKLQY